MSAMLPPCQRYWNWNFTLKRTSMYTNIGRQSALLHMQANQEKRELVMVLHAGDM